MSASDFWSFMLYWTIGGAIVFGVFFLFRPVLRFFVSHVFPITLGKIDFKSYLRLHSPSLEKRVPDYVVSELVKKAYSVSRREGHVNLEDFCAALSVLSSLLIDCIENTEQTLKTNPASIMIEPEWLKACGVVLPTSRHATSSSTTEIKKSSSKEYG